MEVELEAKFLDVNVSELRRLLKEQGATLVHAERLMRRRTFDYRDNQLKKVGGWIRVRDEGDKVTLAYKQLVDRTLEGTRELSLTVEDFDTMNNLLLAIGLDEKSYQETKRERWDFDGVEVTIDTWPWIPTFVEIEGTSEERLRETVEKLGLDWGKALHGSVETAYQAYFNVSDEEIDSWESITFISAPEWLEVRRK